MPQKVAWQQLAYPLIWCHVFFFFFPNKTDEAISLDDLQQLKLAFEVLNKRTQTVWRFISRRFDSNVFFFPLARNLKREARDPLMWKILDVYWRTVWICLTQWDSVTFLLYIIFCVGFPHACVLSLSLSLSFSLCLSLFLSLCLCFFLWN